MDKKFKSLLWIVGTIIPVFLSWILGYLKLPEDVYYLDYVDRGALVLDTNEKLTSDIEVLVKSKKISQLSTYSVSFINDSGKHFDKVKIEFNLVKGAETKLLSSSIEGPADFSISSMRKIEERDSLVVYEFDYIDRASDKVNNYFTVNMLFSGEPPQKVNPISIKKGMKLRPKSDNPKDAIQAIVIVVSVIFAYVLLILFFAKIGNKNVKKKETKFISNLENYLLSFDSIDEQQAKLSAEKILELRSSSYKTESVIARYIKSVVNEP
jgi:hypothetical protein